MTITDTPSKTSDKISTDIVNLLPNTYANNYLLTIQDLNKILTSHTIITSFFERDSWRLYQTRHLSF